MYVFIILICGIKCSERDFCSLMHSEGTVEVSGEYIIDWEYWNDCTSNFTKLIGVEGNIIKIISRKSNLITLFYDIQNKTFANLNFVIIPSYSSIPIVDSLFYTLYDCVLENITVTVENTLYVEVALSNYGIVFERLYNCDLKNITLKFNKIEMKVTEENEKVGLLGNSVYSGSIENVKLVGNELRIINNNKYPHIGLLFYEINTNLSLSSIDIENVSVISEELIDIGLLIHTIRNESEKIEINNCYILIRNSLNIVNQYKLNYFSLMIYKNDNKNLLINKSWINIKLNSLHTKHNYYLNGLIGYEKESKEKRNIKVLNSQISLTIQKEYNQFLVSLINNEIQSNLYMNNSFIFINKVNDSVLSLNQISDIYNRNNNNNKNEIKIENSYYSLFGNSLWINFVDEIKYDNIMSIKNKTSGYNICKDKFILYYEENPYFDGIKLRNKKEDEEAINILRNKNNKINNKAKIPKVDIKSTRIIEVSENSNWGRIVVVVGIIISLIVMLFGYVFWMRNGETKNDKKMK